MAFDPNFLDRLRDALPLAEIVGRRVRLAKAGREFSGLCPFHNEKSPSFTVSEEKGFYHCFGCGAHGDVIGFVMRTEGLSFPEAVERLTAEANIPLPAPTPGDAARKEKRAGLHEALEAACAWFQEQLHGAGGREGLGYLRGRGVAPESIAEFRLGYAPDQRGALRKALNAAGFHDDGLAAAGLVKRAENGESRDYFFDRIIFPITDRQGRVVAFGGRAMAADAKAKYLNSPDSEVFHKGRLLYNLHRARKAAHDRGEVIVAEGYMDVIALFQAGFPQAVAPLGTAVTEEQIGQLWRLSAEPLLCLDGDAAGQRAGVRAAERALPLLRPGQSLCFASLPPGEDPDSFLRSEGPEAFRSVLNSALPLADLLWRDVVAGRRADTPERRAGLRAELLRRVDRIEDRDVREAYRGEMIARFDEAFGRRYRRSGDAGARGAAGRSTFGKSGRVFKQDTAVSQRRPRQSPNLLRRRPEQVMLAMSVCHPRLALEMAEELAEIPLSSPEFSGLREAVLDQVSLAGTLDFEALKCHLSREGYASLLGSILNSARTHEPIARPDAALTEARKRMSYWIKRARENSGQPKHGDAVVKFAEDPSDASLARMRAERELGEESTARSSSIEKYESADPVD